MIRRRDDGMVTAEIAVALPALLLLVSLVLAVVSVVNGQLRCVDAAREAALALARGESPDAVRSVVAATAPHGAVVSSQRSADRVRSTVRARIRPVAGLLPAFTVAADATAVREPGPAP